MPSPIVAPCPDRPADKRLPGPPVGLRLRLLFAWLMARGGKRIEDCSDAEVIAGQQPMRRTWKFDIVYGSRAPGIAVRKVSIAGGPCVRLYVPPSTGPRSTTTMVYFHGGGWVGADPSISDWWCSHFASRTGATVVSVDYRLAPRHRFPAAVEDAYAALCWVRDQGLEGAHDIPPGDIAVAGDSAGGNLAAALCLYARDHGGPRIVHQTLICPALDLTLSSPSMTEKAVAPFLTESAMQAFVRLYVGDPAVAREAYASPLRATDLANLPGALIQVAEHDPLRDDGWRYAARLRAAGVAAAVTEFPGAAHGFTTYPSFTRVAHQALDEACAAHRAT